MQAVNPFLFILPATFHFFKLGFSSITKLNLRFFNGGQGWGAKPGSFYSCLFSQHSMYLPLIHSGCGPKPGSFDSCLFSQHSVYLWSAAATHLSVIVWRTWVDWTVFITTVRKPQIGQKFCSIGSASTFGSNKNWWGGVGCEQGDRMRSWEKKSPKAKPNPVSVKINTAVKINLGKFCT
jgi:hypothetical protein